MIDVRLLRTDLESVRARMVRRANPELLLQLDEAVALDVRLRELATERDTLRRQVNDLSKQVGQLRRDGRAEEADSAMSQSRELGEQERGVFGRTDEQRGSGGIGSRHVRTVD